MAAISTNIRRLVSRLTPTARRSRAASAILKKRFYSGFWEFRAQELGLELDDLGFGFHQLSSGNSTTIVRDSLVALDDFLTYKVSSNKIVVHKLLEKSGLPVPAWTSASAFRVPDQAAALLRRSQSVVCKPAHGSGGGSGVITGIRRTDDLLRAIERTLAICDTALIEEFVRGASYRLLFLDGVLLDAVHRKPPTVIGDGKHSIRRLIELENKRRLNVTPCQALSILTPDSDLKLTLKSQQLKLSTVPSQGTVVQLKTVVNQNNASNNIRVLEQVHGSILDICREAAAALNIRLAGVDLIASDIGLPASEQKLVVNEVNCLPGLHHHYLVSEQSPEFCVASKIIQSIMKIPSRRDG